MSNDKVIWEYRIIVKSPDLGLGKPIEDSLKIEFFFQRDKAISGVAFEIWKFLVIIRSRCAMCTHWSEKIIIISYCNFIFESIYMMFHSKKCNFGMYLCFGTQFVSGKNFRFCSWYPFTNHKKKFKICSLTVPKSTSHLWWGTLYECQFSYSWYHLRIWKI